MLKLEGPITWPSFCFPKLEDNTKHTHYMATFRRQTWRGFVVFIGSFITVTPVVRFARGVLSPHNGDCYAIVFIVFHLSFSRPVGLATICELIHKSWLNLKRNGRQLMFA